MYGHKVKLRFLFITLILVTLILTVFLVLKSLEENVVYFQSPTEIKTLSELDTNKIRVGGMVKKNSININSDEVNFIITDFKNEINVSYSGAVPNLFAEAVISIVLFLIFKFIFPFLELDMKCLLLVLNIH